jgi:hypothetical protein
LTSGKFSGASFQIRSGKADFFKNGGSFFPERGGGAFFGRPPGAGNKHLVHGHSGVKGAGRVLKNILYAFPVALKIPAFKFSNILDRITTLEKNLTFVRLVHAYKKPGCGCFAAA